ncbi:MAG: RNA polymerase sporulation sigma factor SigK [Clostridia bacterium]
MLDLLLQLGRELLFLTGYVSSKNSFPEPLAPDEERIYIIRLANGDAEARGKLIEHNLRLVAHIAKKYTAPQRDADDLISIGTVGLIKAVSTFNAERGSTLATYAARCIENEILMSLRTEKKQSGEVSLNEPIGVDKDGNNISLAEVLGSDPDNVQQEVELRIATKQLRNAMNRALTPRERTVVELRYGLCGTRPMAQREIATILNISRSYVSRMEKKALIKLGCEFYYE